MIDITTVFICIMHITFFYSVVYSVYWFGKKKVYDGFGCWTLAAVCNSCLYASVLMRLVVPAWISIGAVALFMPLSAILRADSILRFTCNKKLPVYLYLLILPVIPMNIFFSNINHNIAIRYWFMMSLVISFTYIICKALFAVKPEATRLLRLCGAIFFIMRIVGLAFEVAILFVYEEYYSVFESPDMGAYLLFTLIAEVGIGLFFLLLTSKRSQEELLQAGYAISDIKENELD